METLPTFPVTANVLTLRYWHAANLKQAFDWPGIVECMQEWSSAMNLMAPAILRIETSAQYLKALLGDADANLWTQKAQVDREPDSWAKRALREWRSAITAHFKTTFNETLRVLQYARGARLKASGPWHLGAAGLTRRPMATDARQDLVGLSINAIGAIKSGDVAGFRKYYPLFKAFEAGAFCFFLTDQGIEVCPAPSVIRADNQNQLHSESGPAFVWLNDVQGYYWHGIRVEGCVVDRPECITAADIEAEPDTAVREVKIDRFKAAHPNRGMPPIRTVTADELKQRYFRACELNRRVDWERICACIRRWAAAFDIPVPRIIRVENSEQLKKNAGATGAYRISPNDVMRRMDFWDRHKYNSWAQKTRTAENNAPTRSYVAENLMGRWAQLFVQSHSSGNKTATSAAVAAVRAGSKEMMPAMLGVLNVWNANEIARGRTNSNGLPAWDISMYCIFAIDALEQHDLGTKFFSWYQLFKAFEAGAFCFFVSEQGIDVCTLPSIVRVDDEGRLHSAAGPAFVWLDDVRDYYWHGVRVEGYVAEDPGRITVADIESETNAEVRRVKIERFGQERYLIESGARMLHQDDYGTLFRKELPGDEPLVMVKVVNATPEPDGSFKDYFLRVPPNVQTAREAVAWTFGKAPDDYGPVKQS